MYSFYGGRPGNSFIIVKTFDSYEKMVTQFKKGPGYSDVHYDEHVLINTLNKLDEDNGKVYRRGYNFNADDGGAEYIGTIVGPQGNAPHLHFTNPETVQNLYDNHESESGSIVSVMDYDQSETESNLAKPEMVAGKDSEGKFHDNIVWKTVSIRTKNNDITNAYIGLTIPYHVFEFSTQSISEYEPLEVIRTNNEHPFFYPMLLKIPKGIHGSSVTDLRITTLALEGDNEIIIPQGISIGENVPFFACTIESYDSGKENSGVSGYENSTKQHYFIDFYKVLDDLELNEAGILTKKYNDGSQEDIDIPIKWIDNIELSSKGELKVKYNTNNTSQTINSQAVKWINNIELSPEGQLQVKYNTDQDNDKPHIINNSQAVKWIKSINLSDDGQLQVTYNTNDQVIVNPTNDEDGSIQEIKWLTGVTLTPAGNLTFDWNVGPSTTFDQIKWIKEISLSKDGILYIGYNNTDEPAGGINPENPIKWIKEMTLDQETGALKITWNTEDEQVIEDVISQLTDIRINKAEDVENQEDVGKIAYQINNGDYKSIGEPINYVTEMTLDENNQVLAKFALNDDWSYLGNLTTNFQIADQDQITESFWAGVGNVVETVNEENNQINGTLNFIIAPSYYIAKNILCQMNSIILDIQQIGGQRKFSQVKIIRGSNGKIINQSQEQGDSSSESSEIYVDEMDEFVQAVITKTGIHFSVYLDKLNEVGWDFVGEESAQSDQQYRPVYPKTGSTKNWFCNVYVSNLSMALNRTDLSAVDETRYFNSTKEFFEYDWDSRNGWNAAFTQDLFTKPSGGNTDRVMNLIERNNDTNYFGDPNVSGASIINSSGKRVAQAIKISRVWGTKKNSFFVDLVRPQPLRRNGVHIVSAQVMWCDSQIPIMVYPYLPDNSSISPYRTGDTNNYPINPDTYAQVFTANFPNKTLNRPTLECIKYGKGQYFRIVILDDTPGGSALVSRMYKDSNGNDQQAGLVAKTPKKLNIVVRFLYYIDHMQ